MKVLLVHPSALMYSEIYLRLEPLGLERVAQAIRSAGHDVRLLDLQIFRHDAYFHELQDFQPQAVGFSLNYLANVPEVIELARATKRRLSESFIFIGGHSASFIAMNSSTMPRGRSIASSGVRGRPSPPTSSTLRPGEGLGPFLAWSRWTGWDHSPCF